MIVRRSVAAGGALLLWLTVAAVPASANDLSDYLGEADRAVYSGQRLVRTAWDGIERIGLVEVEHAGGMTILGSGDGRAMVGRGKMHPMGGEGAVAFLRGSVHHGDDRYTVVERGTTYRVGREAEALDVMEGDVLRMQLIVDRETAAPLATRVFDDVRKPFRETAMVEFVPRVAGVLSSEGDDAEYDVMMPSDGSRLSETAAHYELADVYGAPGGARHSFYTDGLFSFSVFDRDGAVDVESMAVGSSPYVVDGSEYRRLITPSEVWVLWTSGDHTFALVGDLPPDHLEDVLDDLPPPQRRNWFARTWRRLFG